MVKRDTELMLARRLRSDTKCDSSSISDDFNRFITELSPAGMLPPHPPFELHPYLREFPLRKYEKYIIGTFPPITYTCDLTGLERIYQPNGEVCGRRPQIPFYHGSLASMWKYLLNEVEIKTLPDKRLLAKEFLIKFLQTAQINYCDIIEKTQRKLEDNKYKAADKCLWNICINKDLISHVLSNEKGKFILFNSSSTFGGRLKIHQNKNEYGLSGQVNVQTETNSFDLFVRGCQELGLKIEFRIKPPQGMILPWTELNIANANLLHQHLKMKIIFEIRITSIKDAEYKFVTEDHVAKEYIVITPFSPAVAVRKGMVTRNKIVAAWLALHRFQEPSNLLFYIYQNFRNDNMDCLYELNQ